MLALIIFIIAIIAFLVVACYIYRDNIFKKRDKTIKYVKSKKKKSEQPVEEEKPVDETPKQQEEPELTYEDFVPIQSSNLDERDFSLEELFADDSFDDAFDDDFDFEEFNQNKQDKDLFNDNLIGQDLTLDLPCENKTVVTKKSALSKEINNLSPKLKALLIDGVLKKKDF